ncbi:LOW QUALITY PROTEIN: uncharacterized protein LOC114448645 [Xyrichtys novacula]|uniref:LOW QUALITY PROTEIN: uncharacterized protein LOC114448645 n=1 Tax=Xyrichtys novacula TaxID=13765 RepID=A0AAV1FLB6_XYRNO|nr:LOW QUALITY PROTEIN: uncharacterized protein LOC114448645 [Xyrichtys novacula]
MGGDPKRAIDGNHAADWAQGSCTHTTEENRPWWRLCLGVRYKVKTVAVLNRQDCCQERINGAEIHVGDSLEDNGNANPICAVISSLQAGASEAFDCKGMEGRYVSIVIPGEKKYLTLCEVEVTGEPAKDTPEEPAKDTPEEPATDAPEEPATDAPEEPATDAPEEPATDAHEEPATDTPPADTNIARGGTVTQSSVAMGGDPKRAIDGNHAADWAQGSCTHTTEENRPWWRLCLGVRYKVKTVAVLNRQDCCQERINGAEIHVGDSLEDNGNANPICAVISSLQAGASEAFDCKGMEGRYVSIVIPGEKKYLTLCEVEVTGEPAKDTPEEPAKDTPEEPATDAPEELATDAPEEPATDAPEEPATDAPEEPATDTPPADTNIARGGTVTQSSVAMGGIQRELLMEIMQPIGRRAPVPTQQKKTGHGGDCALAQDCCQERINGAEIHVGDSLEDNGNANPICAVISSLQAGASEAFDCKGMEGRYVSIVIPGEKKYLTLCEVEVTGEPAKDTPEEPAKDTPEEPATDAPEEPATDAPEEPATDAPEEPATDAPEEPATDAPEEPATDAPEEPATDTPPADTNIARGGTVTQSSVAMGGDPKRAIDGNHAADWAQGSCTHTTEENRPWWRLCLGVRYKVKTVAVLNRQDCCQERINGAEIHVGDSLEDNGNANPICAVISSLQAGASEAFDCKGMEGRYVSIVIPGEKKYLTLCEVEVTGEPAKDTPEEPAKDTPEEPATDAPEEPATDAPEEPATDAPEEPATDTPPADTNIARGGTVTQSSVAMGGDPKRAIDGNHAADWAQGSCTHTTEENRPWWRLCLGVRYKVKTVAVLNRQDCCQERINGAEIHVGDSLEDNGNANPICAVISSLQAGASEAFDCKGMEGRYVSIVIPGEKKYLTLCEVEVTGEPAKDTPEEPAKDTPEEPATDAPEEPATDAPEEPATDAPEEPATDTPPADTNIARGGTVTQSSVAMGGDPKRAIDGNPAANWWKGSCTHTRKENRPWWRLDLGKRYKVKTVTVLNREDCCQERINGAEIHVGDSLKDNGNANPICAVIPSIPAGASQTFDCKGMEGRYVSIVIPGEKKYLTLCEVENIYVCVYTNIARGGTVTQSSVAHGGYPKRAIDGNPAANWWKGSCTHTRKENRPWWRLDLGKRYKVKTVTVLNRQDCCHERINGAEIHVGDSLRDNGNANPICAVIPSLQAGASQAFDCKGMEGRYVSIVIPGEKKILTLCEVEVTGEPAKDTSPTDTNIARGGTVTQSSVAHGGYPKRAIDGNPAANWWKGSCTHTRKENRPWWRLDLGKRYKVKTVSVLNRQDCCHERINGAEIHVGDSLRDNGNANPICAVIPSIPAGASETFDCKGMEGRYVSIVIPGEKKYLTLCEVEVTGEPAKDTPLTGDLNLTKGGTVTQSSVAHEGYPKRAIDGNRAAVWAQGSCTHTTEENRPWWRVDFGARYKVKTVTVFNRQDCCHKRILGAEIRIGDSLEDNGNINPICAVIFSIPAGGSKTFDCNGMEGHYVNIVIPQRKRILTLCEVEVTGFETYDESDESICN